MSILKKHDLQFDYFWTAIPPDDPKVTGIPDDALLNTDEGYEVLDFINHFSHKYGLPALQAETLIKKYLPCNIRGYKDVEQWLVRNWTIYN